MQRLFSAFPDGWPGRGLLLLRIAMAAPVLIAGSSLFADLADGIYMPLRALATASAIFLLLGLGTPVAAALQVLIEAWLACASGTFNLDHGARAVAGLALTMLGPGHYSIDRRFFGRKRIELGR